MNCSGSSSDEESVGKKSSKLSRKRKLSEPIKPSSACALFFEDTQDAIKKDHPNCSFKEISQIVSQMWDSLSAECRELYKKKTETAKKKYLKDLAEYRAQKQEMRMSLDESSQESIDEDEDEDKPLASLKHKAMERNTAAKKKKLPPPPKLIKAPKRVTNLSPSTQESKMKLTPIEPTVSLERLNLFQLQQANAMQPICVIPSKSGLSIKLVSSDKDEENEFSDTQDISEASEVEDRQPILQTLALENEIKSESNVDSAVDENQMITENICIRSGCNQPAVDNDQWNTDFCSSKCVVIHCNNAHAEVIRLIRMQS